MRRSQRGFTLIELLTVIGIIGVLSALGLQMFAVYRANAAFAAVQRISRDAQTDAESTLTIPDNVLPSVTLVNQRVPGPLSDGSAHSFMPILQVPRNISFSVSFDPACTTGGCQSAFIEARHLYGKKYMQWLRTGDGYWTNIELDGSGW